MADAMRSAAQVVAASALGLSVAWRLGKYYREYCFYQTRTLAKPSPVVLITGASSGIGAELARAYARRGARLALVARRQTETEAVSAECRSLGAAAVVTVLSDVSTSAGASSAVAAALAAFGSLDILVLNAGVGAHALFADCPVEVFERVMAVNYFGYLYCAKAALEALRASRGQIVVVNSLSGELGLPMRTAYCASKYAVTGLFEALRMEERDDPVHITIVCPPSVRTRFREALLVGAAGEGPDTRMPVEECAAVVLTAIDYGARKVYFPLSAYVAAYLRPFYPDFVDYALRLKSSL